MRTSYLTPYIPQFFISSNGIDTPVNIQYSIREVNNRTDYCISCNIFKYANIIAVADCSNKSHLLSALIDPVNGDSIKWMVRSFFSLSNMKGSELYHFQIMFLDSSSCNLSTEFIVYVYNEPPNTGREWLTLCLSGTFFGLALLLGYIYKSQLG